MKLVLPSYFSVVIALCTTVLGCERSPREPEAGVTASSTQPALQATAHGAEKKIEPANETPPPQGPQKEKPSSPRGAFQKSSAPRIVAIGDLHGDFAATKRAFALAGAIDASANWVGGKLVVVQTGDQLDRGDDEADILRFLQNLEKQAEAAGGRVYVLNGNHESMNVLGDFRYVTEGALHVFDDVQPASQMARAVTGPMAGRAKAFLPGGGMAQVLAEHSTVIMVGDTVFAHGGVLPVHVQYGIDRLNQESRDWMLGQRSTPPAPLVDPDGPVWTRVYGEPVLGSKSCALLDQTLTLLGAKRLVVGHTVQERGMSEACEGKVFRIDVGLSRYYGDHPVQVLEIQGEKAHILTEK